MAQFDVHTNLGRNRSSVPYVVNSVPPFRRSRHQARRTTDAPAGLRDAGPGLAPQFVIQTDSVFLNPLLLFAAPVSALGPVVASLSADEDASRIIGAIDQVISQAFG